MKQISRQNLHTLCTGLIQVPCSHTQAPKPPYQTASEAHQAGILKPQNRASTPDVIPH